MPFPAEEYVPPAPFIVFFITDESVCFFAADEGDLRFFIKKIRELCLPQIA